MENEPSLVPQWLRGNSGALSATRSGSLSLGGGLRDRDRDKDRDKDRSADASGHPREEELGWKQGPNVEGQKPRLTEAASWKSGPELRGVYSAPASEYNNRAQPSSQQTTADGIARPGYESRGNGESVPRSLSYFRSGQTGNRNSVEWGAGAVGRSPVRTEEDSYKVGPKNGSKASISPFEADFPALSKSGAAANSNINTGLNSSHKNESSTTVGRNDYVSAVPPYKNEFLSSRYAQTWTSKLADVPTADLATHYNSNSKLGSNNRHLSSSRDQTHAANGGKAGTGGVPPGTDSAAQRLSSNTSLNEGGDVAVSDKQKLAQLAVKQSRQLVPVLASGNRQKGKVVGGVGNTLSTKNGLHDKSRPTPVPAKASSDVGTLAKGAGNGGGNYSRNNGGYFNGFLNLRIQGSSNDDSWRAPEPTHQKDKPIAQERETKPQYAAEAEEKNDDARLNGSDLNVSISHDTCRGVLRPSFADESGKTMADADTSAADNVGLEDANGNGDAHKLKVPAEEEAFLRSLGWTETDDEGEGGLTEEEIAAFKAAQGRNTYNAQGSRVALQMNKGNGYENSELVSSSDSDAE